MKNLFKTLGLLVVLGSLLSISFFYSCGDDDEEEPAPSNIVGFWTVAEVEILEALVGDQPVVDFFVNVGGMTQETAAIAYSILETSVISSITGTIDIRADKTYTSVLGGEVVNGTWAQSADGKTFTIYDDTDDEFVATVNSLTATNAQIYFIYDTNQDLDGSAETPEVRLTLKGNISMTK
jgi:hypothetical protein